jgi:hypothetical protein
MKTANKFLKNVKISIFGNDSNASKSHSWRNYEQIKFGECLLSVQNILSSFLLSNIKTNKSIVFSVVLYRCETCCLLKGRSTLRAKCQGEYLDPRENQ